MGAYCACSRSWRYLRCHRGPVQILKRLRLTGSCHLQRISNVSWTGPQCGRVFPNRVRPWQPPSAESPADASNLPAPKHTIPSLYLSHATQHTIALSYWRGRSALLSALVALPRQPVGLPTGSAPDLSSDLLWQSSWYLALLPRAPRASPRSHGSRFRWSSHCYCGLH